MSDEALVQTLSKHVNDVSEAFAAEIGRRPTLEEVLQILEYGAKVLPEMFFADVQPARVLGFRTAHAKRKRQAPSLVADLNDNVFVLAANLFAALASAADTPESGVTTARLGDWLTEAIGRTELADVSREKLRVDVKVGKMPSRSGRVGDIVAIPAGGSEFYLAIILKRDALGVAYGLFKGRHPPMSPSKLRGLEIRRPVYSGDDLISAGRWRIVGHDESLLSLFPEPEIYHRPQRPIPGVPPIGPFGAAETASGKMRDITREESEEVGLLREGFWQILPPEVLERELASLA